MLASLRLVMKVAGVLLMSMAAARAQVVLGGNPCGPIENHYGPWDYRTQKDKLQIVERFHFTPQVEALIRGESGVFLGGDLSYTLATSPNHLRALAALVRFGELTKSAHPPDMTYSIDCYFDRALRFQPDDGLVRVLYARFLGKNGRTAEAVKQLEEASRLAGESSLSHYNIGLMYFELSLFDGAVKEALLARRYGFPSDDLERRLKQAGKWQEPEVAAKP